MPLGRIKTANFRLVRKRTKAFIDFVLSVYLPVRPSILPHGTTIFPVEGFSWNLIVKGCFENRLRKFSFPENLTRIAGTLHEDQYTFMIISGSVLYKMRNVSENFVVKIKNHFMFSKFFPPKIVPFMRWCGKMRSNQTCHSWHHNTAHTVCMLGI